jgi:hypothetical protein
MYHYYLLDRQRIFYKIFDDSSILIQISEHNPFILKHLKFDDYIDLEVPQLYAYIDAPDIYIREFNAIDVNDLYILFCALAGISKCLGAKTVIADSNEEDGDALFKKLDFLIRDDEGVITKWISEPTNGYREINRENLLINCMRLLKNGRPRQIIPSW